MTMTTLPGNLPRNASSIDDLTSIAPCLGQGPFSAAGKRAVASADALGDSSGAEILRAWSVPCLFMRMEALFASDCDPTPRIVSCLSELADSFDAAVGSGIAELGVAPTLSADTVAGEKIESVTGEHYGRLFERFSAHTYWEEACNLLATRLERNGVDSARWNGKRVLDSGCGGGRYSVAWRLLGAREVIGIDLSTVGLDDARARVHQARLDGVVFEEGSVLDLPFADNSFDVVFSNGVLHHTTDWQRGARELVRTLTPGGLGWLYLIENPGGVFWDVLEILRVILRGRSREQARHALQSLGLPANRVFYMLDHVMVPINIRLTAEEVVDTLLAVGAIGVRRLGRGADFDRVEQIYRARPFAREKYGAGENRFVFSKAAE